MMSCVLCFPWVVIRVRILFGRPFHELSLISQVVGESSQDFVFLVSFPPYDMFAICLCTVDTPTRFGGGFGSRTPVRRGMKLPLPRVELQVRFLVAERPYVVHVLFTGAGPGGVIKPPNSP